MKIKKKNLDIIVPVYNEGLAVKRTVDSILNKVRITNNIFICYDSDSDTTLKVIKKYKKKNIFLIKNQGVGAHGAVMTGIKKSLAEYVLVMPADDDYNTLIIDKMLAQAKKLSLDIVCPSRFARGSKIVNGPFFKFLIVRIVNYSLYYLARIPSKDSTNGFRLFSRRVVDNIKIISSNGFTYSIEYLLKAYEKKMSIQDYPADWYERKIGKSRFQIFGWCNDYLEWYFYAWKIQLKKIFKLNK
jgi:glycosyltransferase involved in cell wall biosynthesis